MFFRINNEVIYMILIEFWSLCVLMVLKSMGGGS